MRLKHCAGELIRCIGNLEAGAPHLQGQLPDLRPIAVCHAQRIALVGDELAQRSSSLPGMLPLYPSVHGWSHH